MGYRIRDGVRYVAEQRHKKLVEDKMEVKRPSSDKASNDSKKQKAAYLVCPKKFSSRATEDEMAQELTEDDLGTDATHRILQCKIR